MSETKNILFEQALEENNPHSPNMISPHNYTPFNEGARWCMKWIKECGGKNEIAKQEIKQAIMLGPMCELEERLDEVLNKWL